jgi:hypothetical protein
MFCLQFWQGGKYEFCDHERYINTHLEGWINVSEGVCNGAWWFSEMWKEGVVQNAWEPLVRRMSKFWISERKLLQRCWKISSTIQLKYMCGVNILTVIIQWLGLIRNISLFIPHHYLSYTYFFSIKQIQKCIYSVRYIIFTLGECILLRV